MYLCICYFKAQKLSLGDATDCKFRKPCYEVQSCCLGKLDHNLRSSHSGGWVLHILHDYLTNGEVGEGVSQGGWLLMG